MARFPRCSALFCVALLLFSPSSPGVATEWSHPLDLAGGGWWRQRIRVTVHNQSDALLAGAPVEVPLGKAEGKADVVGTSAEAIRVCNPQGDEVLFRLIDSDGEPVESGPIPEGSRLVIPVEVKPKSTATHYLYFDNPAAGHVPDFLGRHGGRRGPEPVAATSIRVVAEKPEQLALREQGTDAPWYDDEPADDIHWDVRVAVRVFNVSSTADDSPPLVYLDFAAMESQSRRRVNKDSIRVTRDGTLVRHFQFDDVLLVEGGAAPRTVQTYYIHLSEDSRIKPLPDSDYAALMTSPHNRTRNPSFEQGRTRPDAWSDLASVTPPSSWTKQSRVPREWADRALDSTFPKAPRRAGGGGDRIFWRGRVASI